MLNTTLYSQPNVTLLNGADGNFVTQCLDIGYNTMLGDSNYGQ